jgi:rRNA maturation RNase YbeY
VSVTVKDLQENIAFSREGLRLVRKAAESILVQEGLKNNGEITLCLVDDRQIRKLNRRYLKKDRPTDVIAFDLSDGIPRARKSCGAGSSGYRGGKKKNLAADIAISCQTAVRNSREFGTSPLYEVMLYAAHGVLHVCGYDDRTAKQKKIMEEKSDKVLRGLISS